MSEDVRAEVEPAEEKVAAARAEEKADEQTVFDAVWAMIGAFREIDGIEEVPLIELAKETLDTMGDYATDIKKLRMLGVAYAAAIRIILESGITQPVAERNTPDPSPTEEEGVTE